LFGSLRIDGFLDIDELTLPDEVQEALDKGHEIRASYHFEIVASVRGVQWQMHRRTVRENSAIHRTYDELFPQQKNGKRQPDREHSPHLFSVFLDPSKSVRDDQPMKKRSVSFAFDLAVLVPDYEVDRVLWLDRHYEGGYIYRELIVVEATPDPKIKGGWRITYGFQKDTPNAAPNPIETTSLPDADGIQFQIPIVQEKRPGIRATLRLEARSWT
jgi:hypothetical protein